MSTDEIAHEYAPHPIDSDISKRMLPIEDAVALRLAQMDPARVPMYALAEKAWNGSSLHHRAKLKEGLLRRSAEALAMLSKEISEAISKVYLEGAKLCVARYIETGDMFPLASLHVPPLGQPEILIDSVLLYAPKEVVLHIIGHEYVHLYLRTRTVAPSSTPTTRSLEHYQPEDRLEESQVDEILKSHGFSSHCAFPEWGSAVMVTGRLDCMKEFRRALKMSARGK